MNKLYKPQEKAIAPLMILTLVGLVRRRVLRDIISILVKQLAIIKDRNE